MLDPNQKLDRFLMFLPGFLTWMMLLMPFWLGLVYPKAAVFILTFIAIYWVYKAIQHARGLIKGYKTYKKEITVDWYQKVLELDYDKLPNRKTLPAKFSDLKHFILIPTVKESFEILDSTIKSILDQSFPTKNMLIVVGTEEVGAEGVTEALEKVKKKYKNSIPEVLHYIHPKGIKGEIVGVASPNRTWATSHAIEELKKRGENINDYIFTTFDADTSLHREFLARVTYLYLNDEKRFNHFFETAVHFFHNNIWAVPLIPRIEANNITFGLLSSWGENAPTISETFACYSCALDTVVAADYWDVKFIDDTVFYWRAFQARGGDFTPKYFHIPITADATGGINYVRAHKNMFRQMVRWGWGSVSTSIAFKIMLTKKLEHATIDNKLLWAYIKLERHILIRTSVFLITFGFTMVTFVNQQFKNSPTVYGLPQIMSIFLTAGMFMFIPLAYIRSQIYPAPKEWPRWRRIASFLEAPIVVVNLLTYGFIPWIYAETMLMFGKLPTVTFYTPKQR